MHRLRSEDRTLATAGRAVLKKSAPEGVVADQGGQTWHTPAPADLDGLVVDYLGRRCAGYCERFTIFPNARIELIFNFGSPYLTNAEAGQPLRALPTASLFAPKLARNEHQCGPDTDWFLVQLTLSGCLTLLGESARDLIQQDRSLADIIGADADQLTESLRSAPTFEHRCAAFSGWTRQRIKASRSSRISAFCEHARNTPVATVRQAADWCGIGERRLRDIFATELGATPKQWLSIARAERLWAALHPVSNAMPREWWEYSDESHAHREFKRWTGLTIGEYHAIKSAGDGLVNGGARVIQPAYG